VNPMCTPFASPGTAAAMLKQYGAAYRQCYSWYGPNQPGVNEADPSNPGGCVPDPGGAPPGESGPSTTASACPASLLSTSPPSSSSAKTPAKSSPSSSGTATTPASGSSSSPGSSGMPGVNVPKPKVPLPSTTTPGVGSTLGQVSTGVTTPTVPTVPSTPSVTPPTPSSNEQGGTPSAQQAQQLLNYLLAP
jgi:hypothetical protein